MTVRERFLEVPLPIARLAYERLFAPPGFGWPLHGVVRWRGPDVIEQYAKRPADLHVAAPWLRPAIFLATPRAQVIVVPSHSRAWLEFAFLPALKQAAAASLRLAGPSIVRLR